MRRSTLRRLLVASAWILSRTAAPAADGFDGAEAILSSAWGGWSARYSVAPVRPPLTVRLEASLASRGLRARTAGARIEIHSRLSRDTQIKALRHEAAHVFFEATCPAAARGAPLISEAFALWTTGEAAERTWAGGPFLYASQARQFLARRSLTDRAEEDRTEAALGRLLALPDQRDGWEAYFRHLLVECGGSGFSLARAGQGFRHLVGGGAIAAVPKDIDFLLVDGFSGEVRASEGSVEERRPAGSLLKPSFFGSVSDLMTPRASADDPSWDCPERRKPGERWTWQHALLKSCNGFFLAFGDPPGAWESWTRSMRELGLAPPNKMVERIGLAPKFEMNLIEAARLYAWLARTSPFVVDVLRRTVVEGTLAGTSGADWFRSRNVALKTGTVSDLRGVARHAWIAAVGPPSRDGRPRFLAIIRGRGVSTKGLLSELQKRLSAAAQPVSEMEVQVLGLVPKEAISVGCSPGAPLLRRSVSGRFSLRPSRPRVPATELAEGESVQCLGGAVSIAFPGGERDYWGVLKIVTPAPTPPAELPASARAARARQGSRLVLSTSERHYLIDTVLSEYPKGHSELIRALILVLKHNARVPRHGDRPLCDTTHCQVFGHGGDAPKALRARIAALVDATADQKIAAPADSWLPFHLGGWEPWTAGRNDGELRERLRLRDRVRDILKQDDGTLELISAAGKTRVPCETLRNQLKLLSCPDSVSRRGKNWIFSGHGEGHGLGLDLTAANVRAGAGETHAILVGRFYPGLRVDKSP